MGKFLKYEDSNFRTFKIELHTIIDGNQATSTGKIFRPKKPITKEDLLGAIISIRQINEDPNGMTVNNDSDIIMTSVGSLNIPQLNKDLLLTCGCLYSGETSADINILYDVTSDTFAINVRANSDVHGINVNLENVFIDEFGREQVKLD